LKLEEIDEAVKLEGFEKEEKRAKYQRVSRNSGEIKIGLARFFSAHR
jgi:hypothetical protein